MVFSFFKKQPEKMPERQAARPRAPAVRLPDVAPPVPPAEVVVPLSEPLPDLEFGSSKAPTGAADVPAPAPAPSVSSSAQDKELDFDMAAFDREFNESSIMAIDVAHDQDPLQADIEQVVVLFANGQDAAALSLLETFVRAYPGREGLRFWRLLFDLLQATGDQAAFEKLGVEFAEACETSPPTWLVQKPATAPSQPGAKIIALQGVLTAGGPSPLADVRQALTQKTQAVVIDCGKLIGCDDEVAGQFAELLTLARRGCVALTLDGAEAVLGRLNDRLIAGDPAHAPSWQLLLELLQRIGSQEAFEERAVDYAITFELSPPSWEARPASGGQAPLAVTRLVDDVHYLSGELKNARFAELDDFIKGHDSPILDFAAVRRMDFYSAGQLVNRLAPHKAAGRDIIIRSPNHLVAELMAVVGLNKQARIIVPKS